MHYNGRRYSFVAVCVEVPRFLPVLVDGRAVSCHDEVVQMDQVPIDGRELSCHDETVQTASKKQGTRASAGRPIYFVSAAEIGRGQQNFISGLSVSLIDVLG